MTAGQTEASPTQWVGEVAAILNEFWVLVRGYAPLYADEELIVCGVVPVQDTLASSLGIRDVVFPKGRLVVSLKQATDLYLAATARYKPYRKTILTDPFSLSGFGIGVGKTVTGLEPEGEQALVDRSQAMNIRTSHTIGIGDKVRRG